MKVTYSPPNEPGYGASTDWNDITFLANVPMELSYDNKKHGYMVPITETWEDPVSREKRNKTTERWMSMIDIARTNPMFIVEGEPAPKPASGRLKPPKTAGEYRAHAIIWIAHAEDADELGERWNSEEDLRATCGVGDDDISYLRPIFDARHRDLKRMDAA